MRLAPLALALIAVLAGCARTQPPAPVTQGPRGGAAATASPRPDSIVVQPGETLYAVARRYDVPLRSLIEANGLAPPYALAAGRRLVLPQVRQHIVQPGETLYAVSRRYGVDASTLAKANELAAPYTIKVGQALILPAVVQRADAAPAAPGAPLPAGPPPAISAAPLPPPAVAVRPESAARPTAEPPPPAVTAPALPAIAALPPPTASPPGASPPVAAEPEPAEPAPAAPSGGRFVWPLHGRLLAGFGPAPGGTHNDGINVAAAEGTPIVATDDGIVKYVGNELRGYGNLVLLKHADGWMSAYAHCDAILVKKDQRVRRGQPIARVGATGSVGEPQLHFEMRRGTRALDPAAYLAPQAASM